MVEGQFPTETDNVIEDPEKILNNALAALNQTGFNFADDVINDENVRIQYKSNIKRISLEVKKLVDKKEISVKDGANFAYEMRNNILYEHRKYTSTVGKAYAEKKKLVPKSFETLLDKYSQEEFKLDFKDLSSQQRNRAFYKLIESSGHDNTSVTTLNSKLKIAGKVCILITAALAVYQISTADNKYKEAIKQAVGFGGSVAGGAIAGLAVSPVCGPGAPVCAFFLVALGSIGGSMIASTFTDSFDAEIEELTKWNLF